MQQIPFAFGAQIGALMILTPSKWKTSSKRPENSSSVTLDASDRSSVYLFDDNCVVRVLAPY
jgi:hypothetical protein